MNTLDWDSPEDFKAFPSSDSYVEFLGNFKDIAAGPAQLRTIKFTTPFKDVSSVPVIEMATVFFALDVDAKSSEELVFRTMSKLKQLTPKVPRYAGGWIIEDVENPSVEGKSKAFQACLGWESLEAHVEAVQTIPEVLQALGGLQAAAKHIDLVSLIRKLK